MKSGGADDPVVRPPADASLSEATVNESSRAAHRGATSASEGSASAYDTYPLPFSTQPRDPQRYVFLGEHGRGGLGRVMRAHDRELGRDVALKELLARGDLDEVRFVREVVITARLEHPSIVPIHEAGRWPDGTPFYAMKLVSGRSLHDLIADCTTIDARIALLHHVIAVTDAIAYAHGRDIIHRDLKPSNVIVGDFGETVVIDWGLAKDLTTTEEVASPGGPVPAVHAANPADPADLDDNDELTRAGIILGTPAYMSPEQKRGAHVDQRTDVYAIGTMLWELCATDRVPPTDLHIRHRMLRRAGIDRDLGTIIDKALEPDPERRYRDAGQLATDLKAFKSGARISARDYSLLAMLAHWTRRHRALAISSVAAVALVVIGSLLFVRNVTAERDRADASEVAATRAREATQLALDTRTLTLAESLLIKDPSNTLDVLGSYVGADVVRADQIRAEAVARGVATVRARPHSAGVFWTEAAPDGAILSLSTDGTIARTEHGGTSSVVARGVSKIAIPAYSAGRRMLAYTCDPADICMFDVARSAPLPAPVLRDMHVRGMAFSPAGARLALMSQDGVLRVFDVVDPVRPAVKLSKAIAGGSAVTFIDDATVAVAVAGGVELVSLTGESQRFPTAEFGYWATSATEHKLVFATSDGHALLFEGSPFRVAAKSELCRGPVNTVTFIPGGRGVAYACQAGAVGIWDPQRNIAMPRAQLEGHAGLVVTSPDGEYLVASGGNGIVTVIDLQTNLIASYKGHGFRLTSVSAPTAAHPFVISADVQGAVRVWPLPTRFARVAVTASSPFFSAIADRRSSSFIMTTWTPVLTLLSPGTSASNVREVGPHDPFNTALAQSQTGNVFAAYGLTALVEIWSAATMTRTQVIPTGHGAVSQLEFAGPKDELITSGHDGRVLRWGAGGTPTVLAQSRQAIDKFAWLPATDSLVFSTVDGGLWRADAEGPAVALRAPGVHITRLRAVPAHRAVYAGYANGDVVAIDTTSWRQESILRGSGSVQEIAVADAGDTMAVATNDGVIHVGRWRAGALTPSAARWTTLAARALHITLAPDGLLVAACTDGTIWLYSIPRQRWLCLPTGTVDIGRTTVTGDGKAAVALDRDGRVLWIDLEAARKLLDVSDDRPHPDKQGAAKL